MQQNICNLFTCFRFPIPSLASSKFNYGVRDDYLKDFVTYWRTEYDWKAQEKMMNQFNHFKTNIEGINVHFIHEKPEQLPKNVEVRICFRRCKSAYKEDLKFLSLLCQL